MTAADCAQLSWPTAVFGAFAIVGVFAFIAFLAWLDKDDGRG